MVCVENPPRERCIPMDDGTTIYAKVEGKDDGKPIVLVHGWGLNHEMWEYQVPYLTQRGYKVVNLDLRGFGRSDKPTKPDKRAQYDYERWARDLGTVIKELNLRDIRLVGYSMGGAVAMHYVATASDPHATKLIFMAATGPCMAIRLENPLGLPETAYDITIGLIKKGQLFHNPTYYEYAFQTLTGIFFYRVSLAMVRWIGSMVRSASPQALIGGLEQFRDQDLKQELSNIRTKTRIFYGFWDPFVRWRVARVQQRLILGAMRTRFRWSGHGLFFEEINKLNRELDW